MDNSFNSVSTDESRNYFNSGDMLSDTTHLGLNKTNPNHSNGVIKFFAFFIGAIFAVIAIAFVAGMISAI